LTPRDLTWEVKFGKSSFLALRSEEVAVDL